jgi:hypothetical protein
MEKFTCTDMVYIYRMLSEIKKPSARVKEMLEKLEAHMHLTIMDMKRIGPLGG